MSASGPILPAEAGAAAALPTVVIAGRANAGKSTLFNRIAAGTRAIVSDTAGTTRDLNVARAQWRGRDFLIVDSGGLELGTRERLSARVVAAALSALDTAAVVVFLLDGRSGVTPADHDLFALARRSGRPLVVAVNKVDTTAREQAAMEFHELGADDLLLISAAHGRGITELLDEILARLPEPAAADDGVAPLRVALIGRPNVGKSSLLNRLAGFERALVDESPGTTRDPVYVQVQTAGAQAMLIDTAGVRRRTRIEGEVEQHSAGRALEAIGRAEVLVLVADATEGLTDQDVRLARLVENRGRGLMVVVNKWDLAAQMGRTQTAFARDVRERFPFLDHAPLLFCSALSGDGTAEILTKAERIGRAWRMRFKTAELNRVLQEAVEAVDPPMVAGRRFKPLYVTQVRSEPPRLKIFANRVRGVPAHYVRFLENRFRAAFELEGTPLEIEFRERDAGRSRPRARGRLTERSQ